MTLNEFRKATMNMPGDAELKLSDNYTGSDVPVQNVCTVCPDGPDCETPFIRITA